MLIHSRGEYVRCSSARPWSQALLPKVVAVACRYACVCVCVCGCRGGGGDESLCVRPEKGVRLAQQQVDRYV